MDARTATVGRSAMGRSAMGRLCPVEVLNPVPTAEGAVRAARRVSGGRSVGRSAGRAVGRVGGGCTRAGGRGVEGRLRLTRRGRVVVRSGVGVLVVVAVGVAVLLVGRPAAAGSGGGSVPVRYHVVRPGETLWGIAGEVAPEGDRRDAVAQIVELNALRGSGVMAGQRIALPMAP